MSTPAPRRYEHIVGAPHTMKSGDQRIRDPGCQAPGLERFARPGCFLRSCSTGFRQPILLATDPRIVQYRRLGTGEARSCNQFPVSVASPLSKAIDRMP